MWEAKEGNVFAGGRKSERFYLEDQDGIKVVFLGFSGGLENAVERFEYDGDGLRFEFVATRVDQETKAVSDFYTVWLGGALKTASRTLPAGALNIDRVRKIAANVKSALLVWRYLGTVADALNCRVPASDVIFIMKQWDGWDASLEGRWP